MADAAADALQMSPSDEAIMVARGYTIVRYLGAGAYGAVYLIDYKPPESDLPSCLLACKVVNASKAPREYTEKFLPRELDVMILLNHPHLVHTHSIYQRRDQYYMFMRFAENGDILDYVMKNGALVELQAKVWLRQLALGLEYMHTLELAHRDMKLENVLLTAHFNCKLTDFGFARFCVDMQYKPCVSDTYCGSMSYAAPEILRAKPYHPKPSDVWSLGVMMFVMLNKSMPFDALTMKKVLQQQVNRKYKFRNRIAIALTKECKLALAGLLDPDSYLRLTAGGLMRSDWMRLDENLASMTPIEAISLAKAKQQRLVLNKYRKYSGGEGMPKQDDKPETIKEGEDGADGESQLGEGEENEDDEDKEDEGEEKPGDEKPADEKPADEKPADDKPK